jgi:hypothetical protein
MFYVLFVGKKIFHPNLRGGSSEKFISGKTFLPDKVWAKNVENSQSYLIKYISLAIRKTLKM